MRVAHVGRRVAVEMAEGFVAGLAVVLPFLAVLALLVALAGAVYLLGWAAAAGWHAG